MKIWVKPYVINRIMQRSKGTRMVDARLRSAGPAKIISGVNMLIAPVCQEKRFCYILSYSR